MIHFRIDIQTMYPVRCPICGRDIAPCAFLVVDSLMFCLECPRVHTYRALGVEVDSAQLSGLTNLYTATHGIVFYAPHPDTPRDFTAAQIASHDEHNASPCPLHDINHAGESLPPSSIPLLHRVPVSHPRTRQKTPTGAPGARFKIFDDSDQPNAARMFPDEEG